MEHKPVLSPAKILFLRFFITNKKTNFLYENIMEIWVSLILVGFSFVL